MMKDDRGSGMNAFWTGILGALVGGAAVLLADENTRQSLRKRLMNLMGVIEEKKDQAKERVEGEIKKARNKLASNLKT